ncbi:hydantoinase B/oxoprolinase family protein [Limnohabitans sp.]|uniref:hydantoinase B/oxoprolinase family protein n=1 Tax=Limnohabitans sp. TaxID=1907725 RepID=UPI0038B89823
MRQNKIDKVDPITIEVVNNALAAIAEEITINLARTAHNTIVYEVQDFCTGLLDAQGKLVAQAPGGLPLFVGDLDAAIQDGIDIYGPNGFDEGDVIVTNHTGTCGQHLNNVVVYTPVFFDKGLVGFAATRAHWTDIGGRLAGGFLTNSVSSFEEGLQIRSVKMYKKGVADQDLFRILTHNIRQPESSFGDLHAQIGACRMAERRMHDLYQNYGPQAVRQAIEEGWAQAERIVRARIKHIPDGTYSAESFLDDDGVDLGVPVPIRVKVIIKGEKMTIDLSRMSPQVRGPINSGAAAGRSAARLALKYLVASDVMANDGCFKPLDVILPPGTLVSAQEPAPMSWWQTPLLTLIDTILLAMSKAIPERIPAGHYSDISAMLMTGWDPRTKRPFTNIEPVAGGWGARPNGDGPSATFTIGHGDTFNIPVEVLETRYPLMIVQYGLRRDSGGPGKFRGGLGMERVYRVLDNGVFNGLSERSKCPPWGLKGGKSAYSGEISIKRAKTNKIETYSKVTGLKLNKDDLLFFRTGGGGGFGDPLQRPADKVAEDVQLGFISVDSAKKNYGVDVNAKTLRVNASTTLALRQKMKSKSKGK